MNIKAPSRSTVIVERRQRRRRKGSRANALLQTAVTKYLAQALPPTAFFCVFPMGGAGLFHGLRMRDLGVRAGFPNLLILHDGRAYCIEMQADGGLLLPSQRDCYAALQDARVPTTVARSLEDVQRFLCADCALPMRNWRTRLAAERTARDGSDNRETPASNGDVP